MPCPGLVFEGTSATGLTGRSDRVVVTTPRAVLTGANAVVATLLPFVDRAGFFARTRAGRARTVEIDGKTVGAYRDAGGGVLAVSLTCTHLGCAVAGNDTERSWDCPCHGSRFSMEGEVLEGPAVAGLESYTLET